MFVLFAPRVTKPISLALLIYAYRALRQAEATIAERARAAGE